VSETAPTDELSEALQRRNSLVFLVNNALNYLVAPVFYVGVLHAAILKSLDASDTIANLPESVYLWVAPAPVLIAWFWRSPGLMRPLLMGSLVFNGAAGFVVATMFVVAPPSWLIPAIVAHAAIIGVCNGVRQMCLWELIGRGLSPERRGSTLGWTFGLGPVFAVLGSCASQLILNGNFLDVIQISPVTAPWKYVILFGATGPAMWLAAGLVKMAHAPAPVDLDPREKLSDVLFGLRHYFWQPLIVFTAIAFLLTYGGTMIMNNLSLFAQEALGEAPEKYAGLQLALRFGFKCLAGFGLGWLVTRTHAKASLLTTTSICLAGVLWAMLVPGRWYLLSFGFLGAGELFYVYYLNYIVGCSTPHRNRENTAYTNLITMSIGILPLLFGAVSDRFGFRASFGVAIGILIVALAIVAFGLPKQPRQ
jgi:MFS family permease